MNEKLIFIAIMVSAIFEISYFLFIQYIYKHQEKKIAKIANTFLYEITPKFNEKYAYLNYILIFGVVITAIPYIYYGFHYQINTFSVSMMVLSMILVLALCFIPFIGFNTLKEHLYLDIAVLVVLLAITGTVSYYCFYLYRLYGSGYQLAGMIIGIVLFAFTLLMTVNPKLFDLTNDMDEEGNPHRKKIIFLALSEWILYPLTTLSLIPLLLIAVK